MAVDPHARQPWDNAPEIRCSNVLTQEPGWSNTSGSLPLTTVSSEGEDSGGKASGSSTRSFTEPQTLLSQLSGRWLDFVLENCCVSIKSLLCILPVNVIRDLARALSKIRARMYAEGSAL